MTKNLKKATNLPFFGTVEKGDSLFTTIPFLKNFFKKEGAPFGTYKNKVLVWPSVFFSNYRIRAKTSITTNWKQLNNIQFIIALFPFVFSFSLLIRSRYKEQLFSYLVKDNLPGFCLPYQNLSWETFREITSRKIGFVFNDKLYICKSPNTWTDKSEIIKLSNNSFGDVEMLEDNAPIGDVEMLEDNAPISDVKILENNAPILENDFSTRKFNSFVSREEREGPSLGERRQTNLQNQDIIERLDIYSNLILLEMKPAWEYKQKQFYIGFLPKENKVTLNKLPTFFNGKQKVDEKTFACVSNREESFGSSKILMPLQIKNNKSEKFFEYKFYARKPNFLSFSKNKIDLKPTFINKKPNLINVFTKQPFQQKLFDLDELPLKLDQNYSEVLSLKKQENQKYLPIPGPNLFEAFQNFPNHKFLSDFSYFSSNEERNISNVENGIKNLDKPLQTEGSYEDCLKFDSNLLSEAKEDTNETLLAVNKPGQTDGLLEIYQSDVREEVFSKKKFLENELKKFFYNEGFVPFKNLKKHTNQFTYLDLTSFFTNHGLFPTGTNNGYPSGNHGSRKFANFVSDFSNKEKNIDDIKEFEFFDSIQSVILNLEKDNINLTLPEQSFITKLRLLSGYLYPDMETAKIRPLFVQNIYKNIIFERLNKESLPIKIEVPSSFVYDLLNESNSLISTSNKNELLKEKKPIFSFLPNIQLNYHYLPASQTLLNQNLTESSNVGGIYQKVLTIYKADRTIKKSLTTSRDKPFLSLQTPFRESWEPVTVQSWSRLLARPFGKSWLAITKLSFVFIAFKIFQSLLSNYGKELAFLGFLDDNLKEEFGLTDEKKDKGYRLIKKVKKRFKDVVGIDNILPELGEIVWILRNSGPTFKVGNFLPKGFLFVGPPGTGKTLLVQAIAGEAEVPVLVQSGSSLTSSEENEKGAQRLRNLFEQARKVAPCIVFIDEIDTLGESRQDVMSTSVGTDDYLQFLHQSNQGSTENSENNSINGNKPGNIAEKQNRGDFTRNANIENTLYPFVGKKNQAKQQTNQEQLNLLMQFLIELDGLKSRTGVIVIGATNRPKVLDPALTRPGRFDRVLNLELPGRKKRIEILKFYSRNLGLTLSSSKKIEEKTNVNKTESFVTRSPTKKGFLLESLESNTLVNENRQTNTSTDFPVTFTNNLKNKKDRSNVLTNKTQDLNFSWEYLANRTFGFSTAALATAMNESSLRAILRDTGHTVETIDRGIEVITNYSIEKPKIDNEKEKDPFFITRFAYYQAGKALLHTLLPQHPDAIILKLWPQPKNSRYKESNLLLTSNNNRAKLETRLIGLYAGKAAELLALSLHPHIKEKNTNKKKRTDKIKAKTLNKQTKTLVNNLTKQKFYQSDKRNLWHSNLGIEDLSAASNLAHSLVDKWHFYSNKIAIRRENQIFTNQNQLETSGIEVFELFQQLTEDLQNRISASNISESRVRKERDKYSRYNFQEWSIRPWWQDQITKQTENLNMFYDDWYRIYLPDPEESERNEEWVAPDEYYHNTQNLKNLLSKKKYKQTKNTLSFDITWNDIYKLDRDYIYHALILTSFNQAFSLLDENRELLDYLADYLMRFETLGQQEIKEIFDDFGSPNIENKSFFKNKTTETKTRFLSSFVSKEPIFASDKQKIKILFDKKWGNNSRRNFSRFFNFDQQHLTKT